MRLLLQRENIHASFFFTGRFYRMPACQRFIKELIADGHYLGAHSDQHLLYCDWNRRDSLLLSREEFIRDLQQNYRSMREGGVRDSAWFFLPPYEWYNDSIAAWCRQLGLQLINFTPGTGSNADYTWPGLKTYRGSEEIYQSILNYERTHPGGLNGFMLLSHIGTDPRRKDKFYKKWPALLRALKQRGYRFCRVDELLDPDRNH